MVKNMTQRSYREYVELARKEDIDLVKLKIALEVDNRIICSNFEKVCKFIYGCYLVDKTDKLTIQALVDTFLDFETNEEFTEDEICDMREYKFNDRAMYFI